MADDLPYKAEYAKSSRASCKACKSSITKESLRIARMLQSHHFDGKVPNWFHFHCFFNKKIPVNSVSEIGGFDSLRWEDQEKIKGKLSGGGSDQVDGKAAGSGDGVTPDNTLTVEYAKSGRSSCKKCEIKIEKGEIRIAKHMEPDPDSTAFGRVATMPHWHHVDCFVGRRDELEVDCAVTAEMFPGFSTMNDDDKTILKQKLGTSGGKKGTKKRKQAPTEDKKGGGKKLKEEKKEKTKEEIKEEENLKAQSKRIWQIRDALQRECSTSDLKEMLELNKQPSSGGETALLDRCADGMAFGALLVCEECGNGSFTYGSEGYVCSGDLTEWTKCRSVTKEPPRMAWKIPKELKDEIDYLKKFKAKKGNRIFPTVKEVVIKSTTSNVETGTKPQSASDNEKPLANLTIGVVGRLKLSKATIKSMVEDLGGTFVEKMTASVTCCLSTEGEVTKKGKKMQDCEKFNIPVVAGSFMDDLKAEGVHACITKHSLVPWGDRKPQVTSDSPKRKQPISDVVDGPITKKSSATGSGKQVEKKVKMSVKGGAVVDPDSGLEDVAHVVHVNECVYNAVLGMVDITRGTNSYYKLQILKKDSKNKFYLFRSWGRVGTNIGGNKLEDCSGDRDDAISRFKELYLEKTGNHWSNRKNFVKRPNKFYPLDIDYGQDNETKPLKLVVGGKSSLPVQVQELVRLIFDIESMKKAMVEFEIDLNKMPLGKLSKKQIESAYSILTEAQKLFEEKGSASTILDASNRFYTLIPHDFGMKKPPLLDNLELIKSKVEMLDNLLDIEVAYSLIKDATEEEDPMDMYYKKLKTQIEPLSKEDDDWSTISTYVENTHATTHRHYKLQIQEIFKIDREGESKRYKPFKELHNRRLLWHGSRTTNYAGILSQGLRIAPPEAPVTGYMFGKGVYFADMVSKSANYCNTTPSNSTGLMLLCEVALGNMQELTSSKYVTKLPAGKHSVKGCGRTAPDPNFEHISSDGTIVPYGKGIESGTDKTSLLYNEYIVYDVAQIQMKYLLKLNFDYQ